MESAERFLQPVQPDSAWSEITRLQLTRKLVDLVYKVFTQDRRKFDAEPQAVRLRVVLNRLYAGSGQERANATFRQDRYQ